jgi:tRNA nucleotidyltransferase (CCA-adding enzyme)
MELTKTQKNNLDKFVNQAKQAGFLNWIKKITKEFPKSKIYLVGGAVRDALLQIPTKDYDFVITGVPIKKLETILGTLGWVDLVGHNFGVFKFIPKGFKGKIEPLDIALPRTEHSIQNLGIYKDFKIQSDHKLPVEEDLGRRDFTINAMALDLTSDNLTIIDEFNGLEDLKNKIIRTVGKPKDRFQEDYSRMLRAIRFACQLDFEIEDKTQVNIKKLIKNLNDKKDGSLIIPREILAKEFIKALLSNPLRAFDLFDDLKVFDVLIPEMKAMKGCKQPINYHSEGDVWKHTRLCMEMLDSDLYKNQFKKPITNNKEQELYDSDVVLATLLHDIDKPTCSIWIEKKGVKKLQFYNHDVEGGKTAENICNRLKLSAPDKIGVDSKNVNWLIARHVLFIEGKIDKMRQTKVEKYLMSDHYPGENLLKVIYVDAISTVPEKRKIPKKKTDLKDWISLKGFDIALKRIEEIQKLSKDKKPVPKRLINGNDIIKVLKVKPGKKVGTILDKVREEQLNKKIETKKQAIEYIKKKFN